MKREYLIGVDIGTQGTKAALFSLAGECMATAFQKSEILHPSADAVEENPETQLESVCRTIRECMDASGIEPTAVLGLSLDGQMAGIIGVGKDGMNATPYDSWLDTRCAKYIGIMHKHAGDEVVRKAGSPPSFNHGPKILWWKHERKEVWQSIRSFIQPGGYAAMRLCGLDGSHAFVDRTYLHFSGFADTRNGIWDAGLCREFGVEQDKLPRIVEPNEIIGKITASMASRCGLVAGIPVVAGCGDTAASFLSCGATEPGICVDVAGTASVFATTVDEYRPDVANKALSCGYSAVPGLWHPYAYINGGGMNLEWFRKELAALRVSSLSFDDLNHLAESIQDQETDPYFIPHLGGRVCPAEPELRGAWLQLSWNHNVGHLYKACLEAVALEYRVYLDILRTLYEQYAPKSVRITGGGEKSRVWNRIKADVLGIPVCSVSRQEGAPLGSALLAGFGVGVFPRLQEAACAWISTGVEVKPDLAKEPLYTQRKNRYVAYMKALREVNVS